VAVSYLDHGGNRTMSCVEVRLWVLVGEVVESTMRAGDRVGVSVDYASVVGTIDGVIDGG